MSQKLRLIYESNGIYVKIKMFYFTLIINSLCRYNVPWYLASLRVQKMILFLLQKSTKVFNVNIAGLFVGSLEGAATVRDILIKLSIDYIHILKKRYVTFQLLSTSISYFTVLYSVQH